jgi:hypothetical protein
VFQPSRGQDGSLAGRDRCWGAGWLLGGEGEGARGRGAGAGQAKCRAQPVEAFGDVNGPWPGAVDAQAGAAGGAG